MDATTSAIAEYAATATYDDLPADVVQLSRDRLVDALGCAVGAFGCPQDRAISAVSPDLPADSPLAGWVIGRSRCSTTELAALANTALIRNLDYNDHYPHLHPSDMIGALLANGHRQGVEGRRLLSAIVVGYEVAARISDGTLMRRKGWDQGYPIGLGTVAALGNLLGDSAEVIGEALSIIGTANVHFRSTRAGELSLWKGAATAYATCNATLVLNLARAGMTGPEKPIEGRHGLWEQIAGFELSALPSGSDGFTIRRSNLKYWPVEFGAQAPVWAALRLAKEIPLDEATSIRLGAHKTTWHEIGSEPDKWDPRTRETADHSMPYIFVWAMLHGGVDLSAFEPASYLDPALRPLMNKVTVEVDPACDEVYPEHIRLSCHATAADGRTMSFVQEDSRGFWRNPMNHNDIARKFHDLVAPAYGREQSNALFDFWSRVDEHDTLVEGMALFDPSLDRGGQDAIANPKGR